MTRDPRLSAAMLAAMLALGAVGCVPATRLAVPPTATAGAGLPPDGGPVSPGVDGAEGGRMERGSRWGEPCGPPAPEGAEERPASREENVEPPQLAAARARLVATARRHLGRPFRGDCSGFVLQTFRATGVRVSPQGTTSSMSEALFNASRAVDVPRPGDLAFFHDTYDRNRNHRADDPFTHVGLVETVDWPAVVVIHRSGTRIERLRIDLSRPSDERANDPVRVRRPGDAPGTRYLAGELLTAFGALLGGEFTQMLQAGRAAVAPAIHPASDERRTAQPASGKTRRGG
jgi:hypothetical protein